MEKREAAENDDGEQEAEKESEEEEEEVMDCWDMLPETKLLPELNKKFQAREIKFIYLNRTIFISGYNVLV